MVGGVARPKRKFRATSSSPRSVGCRWRSSGSKKKLPSSAAELRRWLGADHAELSLRRQCELLGLNRSSYYYEPAPESAENLRLMRLIDEHYLQRPHEGSRRMMLWLRDQGQAINRKRVQRLMRQMGIAALCPRPRTTQRGPASLIYPYLLRSEERRVGEE